MKQLVLFLFHCIIVLQVVAQQKKVNIQFVELKDTTVLSTIRQVIAGEVNSNDTNQFFKNGLGYVNMHIQGFFSGDTVLRYTLEPIMYGFKKKDEDEMYPLFYSYVDNRLVLIYNKVFNRLGGPIAYSNKSKKRLRKQVDRFLEKPKKVTFTDAAGKVAFTDKHFRVDHIKFDNGTTVYLLRSGKAILIKDN